MDGQSHTHDYKNGFTIVELLIVVVVIAILVSISVVAYNGMQKRSVNAANMAMHSQIVKLIEQYRLDKGYYPKAPASATYCVGTGYPNGKCRVFNGGGAVGLETDKTIIDALSPYGNLPTGGYNPINNYTVGPYVAFWSTGTGLALVTGVYGETLADCPPNSYIFWNNPSDDTLECGRAFYY